uniref:Uncharacterized protein n=1 Tax=Aegilops tauschii subsp. strangulata TaxID=200361 RepID=A0A453AJQ8_AEGTS
MKFCIPGRSIHPLNVSDMTEKHDDGHFLLQAVVLPSASSRALQQKKISYMICRVDISYYGWVNFEHKNGLERYLISVITE